VLLTGATGFIGGRVLSLLSGHEVLCLSRRPDRVPRREGVQAIAADMTRDGEWLTEVAAFQPDWCVHLAWEGLPDYSLARCRVNLDASLRLLEAVAQAGVQRVVVAGTCWEYGRATGVVSEDREPCDVGVFAATKLALLSVLESVARSARFEYRWARVFFVYGPGQRTTSLIPHLHAAHTLGRPLDVREPAAVQDFVHVDDVASALVALAASDAPSGVFNVGSGTPTSVAYVVNRAARYYGGSGPFETLPAGAGVWADTTRIAASTGWRAEIGIDEGIDRTLATLDGAA
jgi:nucleoside-diphosphate-sugar epimerase